MPNGPMVRERPFRSGDVWRGTLTSCHQNGQHLHRKFRYFPVDLSIDDVDPDSGAVTVTFVTHSDHSFYELKGVYEESTRRLFLETVRGKLGESWEPCDAEAWISPDFSTMSGVSVCESHGACDAGGGEFVLRQEKTQLMVEGAGNSAVNGVYVSKGSYSTAEKGTSAYDGAPVYVKSCPEGDKCEERFVVVHEVVGQYGFWRIQPAEGDGDILYTVCSEDVFPPSVGWRPMQSYLGPPPMVVPVVGSMYELETYDKMNKDVEDDSNFVFSVGLLGGIGFFLWLLVALLAQTRVKFRSSQKSPHSAKKDALPA